MKIAKNLTELVGNTPLLQMNRYQKEYDLNANIIAKIESFNPLSSVKDRIGKAMIEDAEKKGLIDEDTLIVEPTSGNTGIALAFTCASKGYDLVLTMPDTMSVERRNLLSALGAKVVLTPGVDGMNGAIRKAEEIVKNSKKAYMPQQFQNLANVQAHRNTTAREILQDTEGKVDFFVAGIGTGGTITGVGEVLKAHDPNIQIIAVEPNGSPVLSGGEPGPHKIQGIGAGFIPDVLNTEIYDEIMRVDNEDAFETSRMAAKTEGLLVGISSGAALYAATKLAKRKENKNKNIVVLLADTGERYLSTGLYDS